MTDPQTFTAEHRSWQWELVLRYEDGSLPASEWNVDTVTAVADWYAKNLTPDQAKSRYEQAYARNHHRLSHRRDGATVHPRHHGNKGETNEADYCTRYVHNKGIELWPLMRSTTAKEEQCPKDEGGHRSYRQYSMGG